MSGNYFSRRAKTVTLDELDRLAAEKVMGWNSKTIDLVNQGIRDGKHWQPTRNISQAWECLEKMGDSYNVTWNHLHKQWYCSLWDKSHVAECDTAPEAIVRACLKAKGVEV